MSPPTQEEKPTPAPNQEVGAKRRKPQKTTKVSQQQRTIQVIIFEWFMLF